MRILGVFQHSGLEESDEPVFQLQGSQKFTETFWGYTLGEIISVPINVQTTNELNNETGG